MSALPKEDEQPTATKLAYVWGVPVVSSEPIPVPPVSNDVRDPGLTISKLIHEYKTDPVSPYKAIRYKTRQHYDSLMNIIERKYGAVKLKDIKYRTLKEWHAVWTNDGTAMLSSGHAKISMLRTMVGYGLTLLEDEECVRVALILSKSRFAMPSARETFLTADQVVMVRTRAREVGKASIARACAFQFECTFRQGDVIGAWEPAREPGPASNIADDEGFIWRRGIRWEEIDAAGMLSHITSKKQKRVVINLTFAPMVIDELNRDYPGAFYQVLSNESGEMEWRIDRALLPASGPIVVAELDGLPWTASEFRRKWRIIARHCKIPDGVWNMDSRAGAITEATNAGVPLEHAAKAAAHSQTSQTQKYSRDDQSKIESTMRTRAASRLSPVKA